jgi:hypothetical protein
MPKQDDTSTGRKIMERLVARPPELHKDMPKKDQKRGGVIWACPPCVKSRGYEQADLADRLTIAGASAIFVQMKQGALTLSF